MKVQINPSQKIILVIGDGEYPCRKPTLGEVEDMEAAVEVAQQQNKGGTKLVREHLVRCGLPEDVVKGLDTDQIEEVSKALSPRKKS